MVKFNIVNDQHQFSILEAGILGIIFLKENKVILGIMNKEVLIIHEPIDSDKEEPLIIPPRST